MTVGMRAASLFVAVRHDLAVARDRVENRLDVLLMFHVKLTCESSSKIIVRSTPFRAS